MWVIVSSCCLAIAPLLHSAIALGLIRQYFPKGTDFRKVTRDELAEVERKLNDRPRKRLGWKTPRMLFEGVKLLN